MALFGDSITTDHISPAGAIKEASPAGQWLKENGVVKADFNSYGSRRGNHDVMMRGTFANVRIKNLMVPGTEGGITHHQPSGERMDIYDAAERYRTNGTPLVVIAGKEYGSGSSRDWAAKGTLLLGVRAVLAESFERIHRSNLVGMGVLPLQFKPGENAESRGLTGMETLTIRGLAGELRPRQQLTVEVEKADGAKSSRPVRPSEAADTPASNCSGSTPMFTRLLRWMRSKLSEMTARTPSSRVPFAAQSREEPEPYSLPASTTSGTPSCA